MQFAEVLLEWYAGNGRSLPWRESADPYKIWVSEIILQQTRVAQGMDYYHRFLRAFPTVETLAEADEDAVMKQWQGLGYYSRARNLHAAARQVAERGVFPSTLEEVRQLKGVGDYTAAAICSFAFGQRVAVVDGNVYRVLGRYFALATPIDTSAGKKAFAELATSLLPKDTARVADYNQALMDFGALQCVPASPHCDTCPLAESCGALGAGNVADFPVKSHRTQVKERHFVYLAVSTPEGLWLHRREAGDIWQGLYEVPLLEFDHAASIREVQAHPFVQQHLPEGGVWSQIASQRKHVLTHRVIWADCYRLRYDKPLPLPTEFIAVTPEDLPRYALPRLLTLLLFDN